MIIMCAWVVFRNSSGMGYMFNIHVPHSQRVMTILHVCVRACVCMQLVSVCVTDASYVELFAAMH